MNTIICLVFNTRDTYDRHWIRNCGEEKEAFIDRMRKCYSGNQYMVEFYEAKNLGI